MNTHARVAAAIASVGLLLTGCTAASTDTASTIETESASIALSTTTADSDLSPAAVMAANADYTVTTTDEWDEAQAIDIQLAEDSASTTADSVTVTGSTVTITEAGVYRLTGSLAGSVVVDAPDDALVVLILDGVSIASPSGAAIRVLGADDVAIHLADGSTNTVSDAAEDEATNAAIYSEEDVTISGSGSLIVDATVNDGITSKDDLVILDGTITVTAEDDALRGKDSLVVTGGTLDLTAGGDGMSSDGDEGDDEIDWTRGYIYVTGGDIAITAEDDGLQAFTDTVITGDTITAAVADDGVKAEVTVSIGHGEDSSEPEVVVTTSTEGIEAANVSITGGTIDVSASDDGVNASGNAELQALIEGREYSDDGSDEFADTGERLEIGGGTVIIDAEGDGLDSNGSLTISAGTITVHGPTAGANGTLDADGEIVVTGGTVVALGPGGMEQTPGTGGQGWVLISAPLAAGTTGTVVDDSGSTIVEFTAAKNASTVIVSSADIDQGATYTVVVDGQDVGSAVAGEGGAGGFGAGGAGGSGPGASGGTPGAPGDFGEAAGPGARPGTPGSRGNDVPDEAP